MIKRPLCLACLLLMGLLFLTDRLHIPLFRENPVTSELKRTLISDPSVLISGEVFSATERSLVLRNTRLISGDETHPLSSVRVDLDAADAYLPGTMLILSGSLSEIEGRRNPGEFDFRQYYAARNIFCTLKDAEVVASSEEHSRARAFILRLRAVFRKALSETSGSDSPVFEAVALGDRTGLSNETSMLFQISGILHILSVSGLHVSFLGTGLMRLLKKAGAGLEVSILLPLFFLIFYCVITGSGISALRSVIMFLAASAGQITGRIYDTLSALSLAAVLLLLERPACLYDTGFLMSFTAAAGAGWIFPVFRRIFLTKPAHPLPVPKRFLKKVSESLLLSFSILLSTLPVTMYCYSEVSLFGILLNLLAIPAAGIILASALAAMLAGSLFVPAGIILSIPGRTALFLLKITASAGTRLPFCTVITGQPSGFQIFLYYLLLVIFLFLCREICMNMQFHSASADQCLLRSFFAEKNVRISASGHPRPAVKTTLIYLIILLSFSALSFEILLYRPVSLFSVTFLDIGQGDCSILHTPEGSTFLIDSGSSSKNNIARYQLLPYLKSQRISHIDAVFVSHTDNDHISGILSLLEYMSGHLTRITAGALILPDWKAPPDAFNRLKEAASAAGVPVLYAKRGDVLQEGEITFSVLSPQAGTQVTDPNEDGMVVIAEYGDFSALFTGDISMSSENRLLEEGLLHPADLLKVAHHGSRYSSGEAFLGAVSPKACIISCSETNTYGHPAPEAIERLSRAGCQIEYTMKSGAVTFYVKDDQIYVSRYIS
ncbi:MAG: DNA internalization-related competence protein ComEC/Rec2 [Blautia sp.]|nr:DNA internalization-related competence protein ComEC/Rec2 [Blautia sp.]